jgi:hypothetical protein
VFAALFLLGVAIAADDLKLELLRPEVVFVVYDRNK